MQSQYSGPYINSSTERADASYEDFTRFVLCAGILSGQYYETAAATNVSCAIEVLLPPVQGAGLGHLFLSFVIVPVKIDSSRELNTAVYFSTEDFLQNFSCNVHYIVHTGTRYVCANSWCSVRSLGLYYRGAKLLNKYFEPVVAGVKDSVSHGRKADRNHLLVL
jgi:hypothetical protein